MGNINFSAWLLLELDSAMLSLITIIEKRDNMRYIEAESIKREYMDKIGQTEKEVLRAELEATLLKKKSELIQACINRREPVDMDKINSIIEAEKEKLLKSVENSELNISPFAKVTDEQAAEMREMYKEIIAEYHPAINRNMTQNQKEAYERAVTAYKQQCYDALRLAYDMLFKHKTGSFPWSFSIQGKDGVDIDVEETLNEVSETLEADYSIASELYDCFNPIEKEMILSDIIREYTDKIHEVENEIQTMKNEFPFNAVETLRDPEKTQEYLQNLLYRKAKAKIDIQLYSDMITSITGAESNV